MSSPAPFDLLLEIAARARRGSDFAEARLHVQAQWTGIGFSVLGQRLVAPMGSVTEILMVPPMARLPRVQSWVKGVANVRGRLLPVIGLAAFLGGRSGINWRAQRVLVLGSGEFDCGIVVDEVHGLKHFTNESFQAEAPAIDAALARFVEGAYAAADGYWAVFQPAALVSDLRFLDAAR
jgi:twitching motility protein PilI